MLFQPPLEIMVKGEPRRRFADAYGEVVASFDGAEPDFVDRVCRVLMEELGKFRLVMLHDLTADVTDHPHTTTHYSTKLMETLVAAARERDEEKLAVVEQAVSFPFDAGAWR